MNCLICVGAAQRIQCSGPWEERDCPDCGRYRISDELILSMINEGEIFDINRTRHWLEIQRMGVANPIDRNERGSADDLKAHS